MGRRLHEAVRRSVLVLGWAAATALAAVVAWSAVARLGPVDSGVASPLSGSQITRDLGQQAGGSSRTTTTPAATATGTPPPSGHVTRTPPAPSPISRSWTLDGGDVGASCRGRIVSDFYATPRDGWAYEPSEQGPTEISVTFTRGDTVSMIHVACHDGVPRGETQEEHSGGGGDGGHEGGGD